VFTDYAKMLAEVELDAVVIATPSRLHAPMVRQALERGLGVFCEKPFCLDPNESERLAQLALDKGLISQVGYHYRFVSSFQEMKRLIAAGAIGSVTHVLAEAYGPVVLKPRGSTWRTRRSEGGGCLYDYAAHPIDILTWCFGAPSAVRGSELKSVFSRGTEDEVHSTLLFDEGISAQLSVNWSDESCRKMTTKITAWGSKGRIFADRQECQAYLVDAAAAGDGYENGWNVRYTTELTEPVAFYLRGEEYSAQIDGFLQSILDPSRAPQNSFGSAAQTDRAIELIIADANSPAKPSAPSDKSPSKRSLVSRLLKQ
jgi:predicted dehydrogenase